METDLVSLSLVVGLGSGGGAGEVDADDVDEEEDEVDVVDELRDEGRYLPFQVFLVGERPRRGALSESVRLWRVEVRLALGLRGRIVLSRRTPADRDR